MALSCAALLLTHPPAWSLVCFPDKPAKPMMFVTIGPKDGAAQLPNGMIAGKRMVPMAKGKTLFLGKVLKDALGPQ